MIAWELWWTNQESSSVDIAPPLFSMLIYHLGDEQYARWWPQFRDVASPHRHENHQLHGAQSALRSGYSLSWWRNSLSFMKPEDSWPCPQEPVSAPFVEPRESTPRPHAHFCLPNDLLPSDLPTNWCVRSVCIYLPLRSVCPTHLLDLIAVTVFDEEYSNREASHYVFLFSEAMNCTAGARFLEGSLGLSFYFQFPLKQIWCSIFFRCRGGRLGLMTALFCL
jgi:hypothetical protein